MIHTCAQEWIDTNFKFTTDKVMRANNTYLRPGMDRHQPQVHYRQSNARHYCELVLVSGRYRM